MDVRPYLRRIRSEFPDLKFKRATLPAQGMDHVAIFLDNEWVFRFAKNKEYIKHFPNEVKLLDALRRQITLLIPHYTYVSADKSFGGYKKIQGKPLTRTAFLRFPKKVQEKIASDLARFLNELHSFPVATAKALGVPTADPVEYLEEIKKQYPEHIAPRITPKEREYCERIFRMYENYTKEKHPSVMTHYDMLGVHILLAKDHRIAGIIDFGDKALADPARDFNGLWDIDDSLVRSMSRYYKSNDPDILRRSLLIRKIGSISWLTYNARSGTPKSYAHAYRQFKRVMKLAAPGRIELPLTD